MTLMDAEKMLAERRMVEAILFASSKPLAIEDIAARMPDGVDIAAHLQGLEEHYQDRGMRLEKVSGKWQFRTAPDLAFLLREEVEESRRLSRAATETLAIIAYHQPVTRAEIEDLRGVSLSKGTLDVLLEAGWVRPRGRKHVPGRPVLYGTSDAFLVHFGLESLNDLPGLEELKAAGLLDPFDSALESLMSTSGSDEGEEDSEGEELLDDDMLEEQLASSLDNADDQENSEPDGIDGDQEDGNETDDDGRAASSSV